MTAARNRAASLLVPAIVTLIAFAILVGLGAWQLDRLAWKEDLMARVAARMSAAAQAITTGAELDRLTPEQDEYRKVSVSGRFRHEDEVQVYTLLSDARGPFSGPGYLVLTPLLLGDGSAVIVNRGFVPLDRKDSATRPEPRDDRTVTVTGLLRAPEQGNLFTPANDPARAAWFTKRPDEIAAAFGLTRVAPMLIDADAGGPPGTLPQGGETKLVFPNRHLEYALTWFGLAATLLGVFAAFAYARLRGREPARTPA